MQQLPVGLVAILVASCCLHFSAAEIDGFPFATTSANTLCTKYSDEYPMQAASPYISGQQDYSTCAPGSLNSDAQDDVLRVTNMFRYFAGLDPVQAYSTNANVLSGVMSCAQMCYENSILKHTNWTTAYKCYTSNGANLCGSSNLAAGSGIAGPNDAIAGWINDNFNVQNPNLLGHRRWVLAPNLGGIALGLDHDYYSMYVFGTQSFTTSRGWYSWPPEGTIPLAALQDLPLKLFSYSDANFTSTDPTINTCSVTNSDGQNIVSAACYYDNQGFGPWPTIMIPVSETGADCYRVNLEFQLGAATVTRSYTINVWDCSQTDGGNSCLTTGGNSSSNNNNSNSPASSLSSWVNTIL